MDFENVGELFHAQRKFGDRTPKYVSNFLPMKDLAGIQGSRQIEVACGNLQMTHSENVQRPTSNVQC